MESNEYEKYFETLILESFDILYGSKWLENFYTENKEKFFNL